MSKSVITSRRYKDGYLITIGIRLTRLRLLDFAYALSFFVGAVAFGRMFFLRNNNAPGSAILTIFSISFLIGCYRFLNKAGEYERLFIDGKQLEIISTRLLGSVKRTFLLKDICNFEFIGPERFDVHPLAGNLIDYLGFETEQKVIADLHGEGNVSFLYQGERIRFGKNITSWEFGELEVLLYDITNNDFRYTDQYERDTFRNSES